MNYTEDTCYREQSVLRAYPAIAHLLGGAYARARAHTHTHTHALTHTYARARTHTYKHTRMNTHTHTYARGETDMAAVATH